MYWFFFFLKKSYQLLYFADAIIVIFHCFLPNFLLSVAFWTNCRNNTFNLSGDLLLRHICGNIYVHGLNELKSLVMMRLQINFRYYESCISIDKSYLQKYLHVWHTHTSSQNYLANLKYLQFFLPFRCPNICRLDMLWVFYMENMFLLACSISTVMLPVLVSYS